LFCFEEKVKISDGKKVLGSKICFLLIVKSSVADPEPDLDLDPSIIKQKY
jgi:hypothetical protein